jgi:hypothetical protein
MKAGGKPIRRRYVPPKRRLTFNGYMVLYPGIYYSFITIAVRTSNPILGILALKITVKRKVKLSLYVINYAPRHESVWGSESTAPPILTSALGK